MKLFLTSAIGATAKKDGKRCTGKIDNRYGFLTRFRQGLGCRERMIYLSAFYDDQARIQDYFTTTIEALRQEKIEFRENILINGEKPEQLESLLMNADVIFLSGGHLPTQNQYFSEIKLKEILSKYQGIIVAQSAGSMNCATTVYVCPEMPGEAIDPEFSRYRPGLGLTDLNIIPHYNSNRHQMLDGMRFYDDVIAPDTFQTKLYLLTDGSFFKQTDRQAPIGYGKIVLFQNRMMPPYING